MAADVIALAAHPRALDRLFTGEPAQLILDYTLRELAPGRSAVVSSFGAESAVLLHLVSRIDPATPVIFLDTGKHFAETLAFRDRLVARLGLTEVRSIAPDPNDAMALDADGTLYIADPDACCALRKVRPLETALAGFDVWITGRKRHQAATRRQLALFEPEGRRLKVNPIAAWSSAEASEYVRIYDLPAHPLTKAGYRSIGCAPCTTPVRQDEDPRAGRWRGTGKSECGIHLSRNGAFVRTVAHAAGGS